MKINSKNGLSLMAFHMLETGKSRQAVKQFLTANRVKGRRAVVMICEQEMALVKTEYLSK